MCSKYDSFVATNDTLNSLKYKGECIGEYAMRNKIRELRIKKGISQQQCADDIGISRRTLQRYEKGSLGGIEYLKKIADYFHVSLDELGVISEGEEPK